MKGLNPCIFTGATGCIQLRKTKILPIPVGQLSSSQRMDFLCLEGGIVPEGQQGRWEAWEQHPLLQEISNLKPNLEIPWHKCGGMRHLQGQATSPTASQLFPGTAGLACGSQCIPHCPEALGHWGSRRNPSLHAQRTLLTPQCPSPVWSTAAGSALSHLSSRVF